ncbi:hypothetical protein [Flavobacterium sp. 3HN19-14]|uniref:hypothetical protein n=1 Tax=Flavobacterium sp. 3HN19-14 TaxID=3448133 RepID=UPI003EDEECE1
MRRFNRLLFQYFLLLASAANAQQKTITPKVISYDPAFEKLVAADAKLEILGENFIWSEGQIMD